MNSAHSFSEGAEVPEDKTTDNELIAEFMGGKMYDDGTWRIPGKAKHVAYYELSMYSTSWDWLVPVARKFIEKTKNTDMPHAIFMNVYTFSVCGPIGELYENIIKGIKWYNQQKLKNKPI